MDNVAVHNSVQNFISNTSQSSYWFVSYQLARYKRTCFLLAAFRLYANCFQALAVLRFCFHYKPALPVTVSKMKRHQN